MIAPTRYESGSSNFGTVFDLAGKQSAIAALKKEMSEAGFWKNSEAAQGKVVQLKSLTAVVKPLEGTM